MEFEENMSVTVFRKGDLIAFGGSFDLIELTNDIDFRKMTPRSKVKGNILTLHFEDEQDAVTLQKANQWEDGKMQFAQIVRKEKDEMVGEMVQVNKRFATEKGIFFAVEKAGFEEIRESALAFECSVVHGYDLRHSREMRQAVLVVKMKKNKNLLLTQLSM